MQAYKKQIGDIFPRNKLLEIPFYQRAYVWGKTEWERILEDLKGMCERDEEYFLGSVILKDTTVKGANEEGFAGKFVVVDGQQRLTTLLVMMRVIAILNDDIDTFENFFITKNKKKDFVAPSMRHNHKDRPAFERILALTELEDIEGETGVIGAYNYFKESIDEETAELMDLSEMTELMAFVMITVDDGEDEQQIFDTINSLGVRLTTAELLKNYFFSSEDIDLYKANWEAVFEADGETRAYWDQEITTGRFKRSLIDIFFDSLLQILVEDSEIEVTADDKKAYEKVEKLFQSYRNFIEIRHYRSKQYVLDSIKPFATWFKATFNPDACDSVVGKEPGTDRINVVIFGLRNSTLIPYILYLRSCMPNDEETFSKMLGILESFIMRRIVCRETTKNYNRFFNGLIREDIDTPDKLVGKLAAKEDVTTAYPDDDALKASFHEEHRLTSLQARGILYLLETAMWPEGSSTTMLGFKPYSLEHLMPKKWRNHWGRLGNKEAEEQRDRTLLTLGNLAVIPQKLNGSISDSAWKSKKAGTKRTKGLTLCAGGLPSMVEPLASDVWNEDLISERADLLLGYATIVWHVDIPDVPVVVEPDNSETVLYFCTGNESDASGYLSSGGFTVQAGSRISSHIVPSLEAHHPWSAEDREELIANGTIVDGVFQKDHEFESPARAADVIIGRPTNGQEAWSTKDGKQLKEQ